VKSHIKIDLSGVVVASDMVLQNYNDDDRDYYNVAQNVSAKCHFFVTDSVRQLHELREQAKELKSVIHRLNQELSRYQTQFRKLDDREVR